MHIYLDHNATHPLKPEVLEAMRPLLEGGGGANASSLHGPGQRARLAVESAREEVAALVGCDPMEVVFTSGGTESDNLAVLGVCGSTGGSEPGRHVVSTAIEHPAVEECLKRLETRGVGVTRVPPRVDGSVDGDEIARALRPSTRLVSVMLANNETGALLPVEAVVEAAKGSGIPVHTDAVQVAGRYPVSFHRLGADLMSISAHKMGGPQGVGALIVRRGVEIEPRLLGGPQERRRRGGTEPVALIAGFGEAARLAREEMGRWAAVTAPLRERFETEIAARFPAARVHAPARRVPNTASIAFPGHGAEALVMALDLHGIAVSTGSACSSGAALPSRVLAAMGLDEAEIASTIRVSFGPGNTGKDLSGLLDALDAALARPVAPATRRSGP